MEKEQKNGRVIPKIIHYCWFGKGEPSVLSQRCMASWQKVMPGFELRLHDETNTQFNTPLLEYLYRQKSWAFLSDYIRLRALHEEGGIYLDVDVEVMRSFEPLLKYKLFLGYESRGRLNSSVLGSRSCEPFLRHCMNFMDQRFAHKRPYRIAPEVMTEVYAKHPENVICLNEEYFYPYNPHDNDRRPRTLEAADITENTYAIHHWQKQWRLGMVERLMRKLL
jgi:mannosyltransferase OCH1-like enzyme